LLKWQGNHGLLIEIPGIDVLAGHGWTSSRARYIR